MEMNEHDVVEKENETENVDDCINESENVEDIVNNMQNVENVHGKVEEPKVGMVFKSNEDLLNYYKTYGKQLGFTVNKRSNKKGDDGELHYVTIACSRSGKPTCKSSNKFRQHLVSKIDCKAKIRATLCHDKMWRLSTIVIEHNHELSPGKTMFYRRSAKRKTELNDRDEIRINKNYNSFVVEARSNEKSQLRLGVGDATALQNYLMKMQADNANFVYMIDLDEEGRLRNVFWADARSRAAYEEFSDVITFDTTYLTNKYDIPFAPFVGVNHHGQPTLLGCGLISSEDTPTFTWLFQSFLVCMSGRAPSAIITDQDKAIQNAIEIVFPSSRHRWCLWNIMKKLPKKLRGYKQYESIIFTLQNIVYDSLSHDVFEESWNQMVEKYNLHTNDWLIELYNERRRWVPAFVKNTFWAGMSTTQQSEGMHAFFDGYVNSKTTLKQFMEQYCNALRSKVEKETHEDSNSFTSKVPCVTRYHMEKQLQDIYTTAKFKEFQHELTEKMYCAVSLLREDDGILEFEVSEDINVREIQKCVIFKVWLHEDDCRVNCICRMFEFRGILCRHVLAVLTHRKIYSIPDKYIIHRWRKDVKRCYTRVKISYDDWNVRPEAERYDSICKAFCKVADLLVESEDKYNMVMDWISMLMEEGQRNVGVCGSNQPTPKSTIVGNSGIGGKGISLDSRNILTSLTIQSKGFPPFKRKQLTTEQTVRKKKEKKNKDSHVSESDGIDQCVGPPNPRVGNIIGRQENIMVMDSHISQHINVGQCDDQYSMRNVNQPLLWGVTQKDLNHPYGWLGVMKTKLLRYINYKLVFRKIDLESSKNIKVKSLSGL